MKKNVIKLSILSVMVLLFISCQSADPYKQYGLEGKTHAAVTPAYDREFADWWMPRHQQIVNRMAQGNVDLLFIGDSITHAWESAGKDLWEQYYAPRNAVNMGFSGDQTQQVLWRLENGEIDGINPKLAVIMIGTNNSNGEDYTAEQIADGIKAITAKLRTDLPKTKVLILAIFPRGSAEQMQDKENGAKFNQQWAKNHIASELASKIADNKMVYYLNINDSFLNEEGILTREIMPDLLHLSTKGYQIWAESIEPTVKKLMGEK